MVDDDSNASDCCSRFIVDVASEDACGAKEKSPLLDDGYGG